MSASPDRSPLTNRVDARSFTGARWAAAAVEDDRVRAIAARTNLSSIAARCVAIRWADAATMLDLEPSLDQLHDPMAMHGMDRALDRLRQAIRDRQRVRIITDYDVDGTTSSLILQAALRLIAPDLAIDYHIPDRFEEGYGFSVQAAEAAARDGIGLIVTADIGVRDHASVDAAHAHGVDTLICDHHLPSGASVPERAIVLCPPQEACSYPNRHLAACGVSLKLAQSLLAEHRRRDDVVRSLLKLAAIGTVADLVPLTTPENRAIVALGLQGLNELPHHAGLQALLDVASLRRGEIDEVDLGFRIGPRINAAGRVSHARLVVELLNCRDGARSMALAQQLDHLNSQRRDIQRRLVDTALTHLTDPPDPFVLVAGPEAEGWHRGVVGIVASRLKDQVHRPTAVVSIQGDRAVGSVRSVPGVHAVHALESASDLLLRFGGHPAAAGFTVPTASLDALRERLCAWVTAHTSPDELVATHTVDARVDPEELDHHLRRELDSLGPFGMGNPRPRLLLQGVRPRNVQVKADGRLLKFEVATGRGAVEAVWWGQGELASEVEGRQVDLLGSLDLDTWRGGERLRWQVKDAREAAPQPPGS